MRSTIAAVLIAGGMAGFVLSIAGAPAVRAERAPSGQLQRGAVKELAPGKLLVAARHLPDPNFAEAIVLLAEFQQEGAMGLIVNRPTDVTLADVAPGLVRPRGRPALVFFGGPVEVTGVLALARSATALDEGRHVCADVYLVNTRKALDRLLTSDAASERVRVYVGYAGWGAGQLEAETAQGAWHVFDGEGDIVFDPEPDTLWQRQIRRTDTLLASGAIAARDRSTARTRRGRDQAARAPRY